MTNTSAHLKWRLLLAISAVLGGTLTFAGASLSNAAAPAVSAANVSACSSVSLEASVGAGTLPPVSLTAAADCGGTVIYAFFERSASTSPWTLIRGWGGPTFTASANPSGPSGFLAWATDGPPTVPQVQAEQDVTLASNQQAPCTATSISPNPDAVTPYQSLAFTATAQCPAGAKVEYSYFVRSGASVSWTLEAAWVGPSWSWTAPASPGLYQVLVWASDGPYTVPQVQSSTNIYDDVATTCTAASVQPVPATGGPSGSLTLAASSTCPEGYAPEYSYFVGPSGSGPWTLMAAWIGPSWTWNPSATATGTTYAIVWVSDGPYTVPQAQAIVALEPPAPVGCSAVTVSTAPSGSATAGSIVSVVASSTCTSSSTAEYSYFTGGSSSGPWTLQAAWIGPTWTWNTAGDPPATYYILVWASDGPYSVPQVQSAVPLTLNDGTPASATGTALTNPSTNLAANFGGTCWEDGYQSLNCQEAEVADIDSALASEGLQPLTWSAALYNLPLSEEEFVVTNEERVLRGLAPIVGMATAADQNALAGAQAEEDPPTQEVPGEVAAQGNWAEDYGALASDFDWMYNDGPGSFNIDCPSGSSSSGCWVHREAILTNTVYGPLAAPNGYTWVAGDACIPDTSVSYLSICDLEYVLVPTTGVSYDFTWAQALAVGA
jgi:hypothetical protein